MTEEVIEAPETLSEEGAQPQSEPAQQSATGTDTPQEETTEQPQEDEEHKRSRFQRRLDRQKAARIEAETRARMLEERLAQLEGRNQQPQRPAAADQPPKIGDFQDIEAYTSAVAEYKAQQILEKRISETIQAQREANHRHQQEALAASWSEKVAKTANEFPDWEDVAAETDATVTDTMQRAILESDHGPRLAYYLAKNPDEAERIARMSPVRQIAEIGKLEDRVLSLKPTAKAPSKAPAPISPVSGRAKATTGLSDDLSVDDWLKERQRQLRASR